MDGLHFFELYVLGTMTCSCFDAENVRKLNRLNVVGMIYAASLIIYFSVINVNVFALLHLSSNSRLAGLYGFSRISSRRLARSYAEIAGGVGFARCRLSVLFVKRHGRTARLASAARVQWLCHIMSE